MQAAGCLREGESVSSSDSSVSDYCRLCTISLKVKFGSNLGKQGHSKGQSAGLK